MRGAGEEQVDRKPQAVVIPVHETLLVFRSN